MADDPIETALSGQRPCAYEDERFAPELDRQLLIALVRGELPDAIARDVYRLIHSFKSWNEAHLELLVEEFQHRKG